MDAEKERISGLPLETQRPNRPDDAVTFHGGLSGEPNARARRGAT
jgi:hypothetical protein